MGRMTYLALIVVLLVCPQKGQSFMRPRPDLLERSLEEALKARHSGFFQNILSHKNDISKRKLYEY